MLKFKCACCDDIIEGIPTFGWKYPISYLDVPKERREKDVFLTEDLCVIADKWFFVRGCLEIPVIGHDDPFIWGVWVSLSEDNFMAFQDLLGIEKRAHNGPYFGWLNASINIYPETENLKTMVHIRDDGNRPYIELEPTDHPLALEQRNGITIERVAEIYANRMHGLKIA
ncbi:MAG: DUF2199 domain-containing protein [Aquipseudomonas alcaligenes]|uniref:DUF2199 domain-containing protein n=1 Tax=Aquipseudomonas alcaligenes TaxID=43263 RepID=A0A5C7W7Y9_AQUAC|nr:MAG: DUF2199 domain-containing protein [Pseudomonas alcaligenes]